MFIQTHTAEGVHLFVYSDVHNAHAYVNIIYLGLFLESYSYPLALVCFILTAVVAMTPELNSGISYLILSH